jgi:hypothetical protein
MKNTTHDTLPTIETTNAELEAQIAEIIKQHEGKPLEWLLVTQQHDFPCEGAPHDAREVFIQDLANALTCHCAPIAILHQGKRLTVAEVEVLEKEALELLGPISRAKAEGRL